ncbi:MAG: Phage exported protein [uncultured Clostridium sp.]
MMETLKKLLQIKKLIALILTLVFSVLALKGQIGATEFLTIFSMVIAFYFGQSSTRQAIKEVKDHE